MGDWEESGLLDDDPIEPSGQIDRWRRATFTGGVLTGVALGLQEVLYPRHKEEIAIVVEAGEPPGDRAMVVEIDPDDPDASTVTIRR